MSGVALQQHFLRGLGLYHGKIDDVLGPLTERAIITYERTNGGALPWMAELRTVVGLHERRDHDILRGWLKSDGKRVGDPAKLPWCGDAAETAIKLSLPDEPFRGTVGENPYYARNWLTFGKSCAPTYGGVFVFERGPQAGHVGFGVGQTDTAYLILGGNQGDMLSMVLIAKTRLLGVRWPISHPAWPAPVLPTMRASLPLSTNEG